MKNKYIQIKICTLNSQGLTGQQGVSIYQQEVCTWRHGFASSSMEFTPAVKIFSAGFITMGLNMRYPAT